MNPSRTRASILVLVSLAFPVAAFAVGKGNPSFYDRHVIFDNSPSDGGYESSEGYVVAPSALELHNGTVPVESGHFVSPPNALRLSWTSASGGEWRVTMEITRRYRSEERRVGKEGRSGWAPDNEKKRGTREVHE